MEETRKITDDAVGAIFAYSHASTMITFDPMKLILPLVLLTVTACSSGPRTAGNTPASETVETAVPVETMIVRFGSSHGMCVGYCTQEYELRSDGLLARRKGGGRGDPSAYPEQEQFVSMDKAAIDAAMASFGAAAFDAAPDVIGCPDCADGGRCWVEVVRDGKPRMVTFDCSSGSEQLKPFTDVLWQLAEQVKWTEVGPAEH